MSFNGLEAYVRLIQLLPFTCNSLTHSVEPFEFVLFLETDIDEKRTNNRFNDSAILCVQTPSMGKYMYTHTHTHLTELVNYWHASVEFQAMLTIKLIVKLPSR